MIAGKYTLLSEVGRGGAGVVWLAFDESLGRQVALKRYMRTGDERAEGRAWREARLAASLHHPHLVAMYDVVEDEDHLWLVMEYVSGGTLAGAIAQAGSYDPDAAARVGLQIADGLAYAHAAGIVHRDVKPSNILLTPERQAKLADFGIARGEDVDATVTQTGVVHGSPAYLSPEVAAGGPATALSDSWSLGATLYHAVTGTPPYEIADSNLVGVLYRIVHDPVPRTERGGWLRPMLDGAMTREPEQRWTVEQIRDFLAAGPPGRSVVEPPPDLQPARPSEHVGAETVLLTAVVPEATAKHAAVRDRSGRRSRRAWVVAAAVLAAAGFGVAGIEGHLFSGSQAPAAAASDTAVTGFVKAYLAAAPVDQPRAFAMLTPSYQQASGGLDGYRSFWSQVAAINSVGSIQVASGTSQHPTATYTYTYTKRSNAVVTETVTLDLVESNGSYLIDGATSQR